MPAPTNSPGSSASSLASSTSAWIDWTLPQNPYFHTSQNHPIFEQTFKNIDDILHKDAGCGSELDYVEQTSWILFLKYLDDLEQDRATAAELTGKTYAPIIAEAYRWGVWAAPPTSIPTRAQKFQSR